MEGAKSWSEGEDIARHVMIGPVDGERYVRRNNYGGRGGNRRPGGRGGYHNNGNRDHGGYRRDHNRTSRPARSEAPTAPAQPKVDSGSTALYGKIEIKK